MKIIRMSGKKCCPQTALLSFNKSCNLCYIIKSTELPAVAALILLLGLHQTLLPFMYFLVYLISICYLKLQTDKLC